MQPGELMNDQLRAWIAPLLAEAKRRGIDLGAESKLCLEGQAFNWLLFGELAIAKLDLKDYPQPPRRLVKP